MRRMYFLLAAVVCLGLSTSAFGQGFGGGSGSGGGLSGGTSGLGGGSGGIGLGGSGGLGSTSLGGGTSGGLGSTTRTTGSGRTGVTGARAGSSGGAVQISASNFLSGYYSNPLYFGRPGSTTAMTTGGGFGQASYGAVSTTGTTAGRTTGLGGTGGLGGGLGGTATARGGNTNTANQQGNTARITHTAELKFPVKGIDLPALQADLQEMIANSSQIQTPATVRVVVTGGTVVLVGRVTDADEKRLVEGMIRLTPGVREVKNELEHP